MRSGEREEGAVGRKPKGAGTWLWRWPRVFFTFFFGGKAILVVVCRGVLLPLIDRRIIAQLAEKLLSEILEDGMA